MVGLGVDTLRPRVSLLFQHTPGPQVRRAPWLTRVAATRQMDLRTLCPRQDLRLLREARRRALLGVMLVVKGRGAIPFPHLPRVARRHLLAGLLCQLAPPFF
jgi:hypothetical protein